MGKKNMNIPWVEKYRPKTLSEMQGFEDIKHNLVNFIDTFFDYKNKINATKKAIKAETDSSKLKKLELQLKSFNKKLGINRARILMGPPGIGKTTIVYALANEKQLSVIEMNASDSRTKDKINEKLNETVKSTNLLAFTSSKKTGKLILIDEVDGIHGNKDRGGVQAIAEIVEASKYPVIMTCNFKESKLTKLYKYTNNSKAPLEIALPVEKDIINILKYITEKEAIQITEDNIKLIAHRSQGDYRSAINDFQALTQGTQEITQNSIENLNMARDTEAKIQQSLYKLFDQPTIRDVKRVMDTIDNNEASYRDFHLWINENLPVFLKSNMELAFAYNNLAHVDKILGVINQTQDYSHLSYYFDILSGGIRFSKLSDKKIPIKRLNPPKYFRLRAPSGTDNDKILQHYYRCSLDVLMKKIKPNLQKFVKKDPKIIEYLFDIFKIEQKKRKATAIKKILE